MNKKRFWYWLFSSLFSIALLLLTFIYPTEYDLLIYIIIAIVLVPNFRMRRNERNILFAIMNNYLFECDAKKYLDNLTEYYDAAYLSKKKKRFQKVMYALIYIDLGEVEKAKDLLLSLVDYANKFDYFQKFSYYRAWISIYYEQGEVNRMKILLDECKKIANDYRNQRFIFPQLFSNCVLMEAKYFICEGIYYDKARSVYEDIVNSSESSSPLSKLSAHYYLGVINYKIGNLIKAKEEFNYLIKANKNIYLTKKSQKYLELIEK